ncbi:putative Iron transport multicopper oxidase FET3 [Glarea lozoyensis 74030]|uniref:Putative Iron transport multicopper oxidase FET3 n=1 Tax=Glarea lozoyensis (strain ATCC 74030 / MF5533) TaxID=1104152 RepID=H0ERR4_GLAL7|nr:putative Iron transport multicopper oxidase FET3 [Glarea lozoyensis 74030]
MNFTLAVQPGKTYLFHMVNVGAFAGQYIWFEGHNMTIVEVDGVHTDQAEAQMIYLSAAQRCSFLLTTKNETTANYAFVASMDTSLFDVLPDDLQWNSTGHLVYNKDLPLPEAAEVAELDEFDDFTLVPYDHLPLYPEPDQTTEDHTVYGEYSHPFVLEKDQIIDIVVNNLVYPAIPMRRDTLVLHPDGNLVIRFKANNPGVWLFHCQAKNTPMLGNAAGNTKDLFDLSGQTHPPNPLPAGFTTKGIVAMTFSVLAALLGLAAIAWYGLADMGEASRVEEERRIARMATDETTTVGTANERSESEGSVRKVAD